MKSTSAELPDRAMKGTACQRVTSPLTMRTRVDAGSDVAMLGAWDEAQNVNTQTSGSLVEMEAPLAAQRQCSAANSVH